MLLLAVSAATATFALGLSLGETSQTLYRQTREATAGPDLVALAPDAGPAVTPALDSLTRDPAVVARNGPYRMVYATLTARGATSNVVVHAAAEEPGAVNRPLVTSGQWVRPGGTVLEQGFAAALGVHVGDHATIAGRSYPVVGIAVTAATTIYPWARQIGPGGGPSIWSGLAWLTPPDARALASSRDLPVTMALDLKLRDPAATLAFIDAHPIRTTRMWWAAWQDMALRNTNLIRTSQPILVVGSWLLAFLAVTGVAAMAAGRAAAQTYRAGVLKAVGATPGLIAAVLFTEYLVLALLADVVGLTLARLAAPAFASPSASLIVGDAGLSGFTIAATTALAVAVAALATLAPTLRALRTATVTALAGTARRPRHRPRLTSLSALLPTPLLLGLRLTARRPGRALLHACATAATMTAVTALLTFYAQQEQGYGLGSSMLPNLRNEQDRHLLLMVTIALIALAAVNTITLTWTTAMEATASMAIARTLGATPGQVSAGLSAAQLLPVLPGAVAGVPLGLVLFRLFGNGPMTAPPLSWLLTAVLTTLLATAALTAVPARLAARRSVARTLSAETA
ncbi:FtsX-like permease family protein [Nonomuraea sp. NPDC050404]|uniref:FtsX-like permease family protein n=1 Tax=Nonomuraea sp. NPDC050404 TaxID=3155783 RepID=UPI0033EAF59D